MRKRDRHMIVRRFLDGESFNAIATRYGTNVLAVADVVREYGRHQWIERVPPRRRRRS